MDIQSAFDLLYSMNYMSQTFDISAYLHLHILDLVGPLFQNIKLNFRLVHQGLQVQASCFASQPHAAVDETRHIDLGVILPSCDQLEEEPGVGN